MEQGQRCQYSDWLLVVVFGVQISSGVIDDILPKTEWEDAAASHLHLELSLKMSEAIPLVPHMPSWHGQEQLYFPY
jgi:hypothetical protein